MKKAVALVLLCIFSFQIAGYTALFFIEKHQLRKEMLQQIKSGNFKADLITITVNASNKHQIIWHEKNEFEYKKNMYDVVSTKKQNKQTTVYYCITDANETKLLKKLKQHLSKNKRQNTTSLYKIAFKYLTESNKKYLKKEIQNYKPNSSLFFFKFNFYKPLAQDVKSPPPKLFL